MLLEICSPPSYEIMLMLNQSLLYFALYNFWSKVGYWSFSCTKERHGVMVLLIKRLLWEKISHGVLLSAMFGLK